ncbi:MAG: hypothetical protein Q9M31_00560 [Mariprofundus sp.]|nr:hypothetical protein [Mariprofundus sp.]
MSVVKLSMDHPLSQEGAVSVLNGLFSNGVIDDPLLSQLKIQRQGHVFTFAGVVKGFAIRGALTIEERKLHGEIDFPWLAKPFQATAVKDIYAYLAKHLQ